MQATATDDRITVTLSYANVRALHDALSRMQRTNNNAFTLSKLQDDGVWVSVEVNWEDDSDAPAV